MKKRRQCRASAPALENDSQEEMAFYTFVERKDTPRDEKGNYDFECIEAIDLELFNDHLTKLLNAKSIA